MADHAAEANRRKSLRDALLHTCKDHNADECIRAAAKHDRHARHQIHQTGIYLPNCPLRERP